MLRNFSNQVANRALRPVIEAIRDRLSQDTIFDRLLTMSWINALIHVGEVFQASFKFPEGSTIADDASIEVLIQVGATSAHMKILAEAVGTMEFSLFENTTISDAGTLVAMPNLNRTAGQVPTTTITHTPTVTADGARLFNRYMGLTQLMGTLHEPAKWILAANTIYLLRLTNRGGAVIDTAAMALEWYERN